MMMELFDPKESTNLYCHRKIDMEFKEKRDIWNRLDPDEENIPIYCLCRQEERVNKDNEDMDP